MSSLALCLFKQFLGFLSFNLPFFFSATWVVPLLWQIPHQIVLQQHNKKRWHLQCTIILVWWLRPSLFSGHQAKFVKTTSEHGNASLFCNGFISLATFLTHWHLGRHSETLQNMCKYNVKFDGCLGLGLGLGNWHSILTIKSQQVQLKTLPRISNLEAVVLKFHVCQLSIPGCSGTPHKVLAQRTLNTAGFHVLQTSLSLGVQMTTSIASRMGLKCWLQLPKFWAHTSCNTHMPALCQSIVNIFIGIPIMHV